VRRQRWNRYLSGFQTSSSAGILIIIELFYLLLCPYYCRNNVKELLLIVGSVKYHYPEMKSSSTSSRYEFKTSRSGPIWLFQTGTGTGRQKSRPIPSLWESLQPLETFSKTPSWFSKIRKSIGFREYWFRHPKTIFGYPYFTVETLFSIFGNRKGILEPILLEKIVRNLKRYTEIPFRFPRYLIGNLKSFWTSWISKRYNGEPKLVSEFFLNASKGFWIFKKSSKYFKKRSWLEFKAFR